MFGSAKKVPITCPHCGSVQLEPRELISTYCRSCGDHFSVAPQPAVAIQKPAFGDRLFKQLRTIHRRRTVACPECNHRHHVPAHTRTTHCPACGATVDLHDIEITGHSTRIVQTRGTVHVGREGFLNSTRVTCGHAFVEGRIAGKITCEGTLRLRGEGLCRAQIRTKRLLIDRGANLRFLYTVFADEMLIRGVIEADVQCAGRIHVGRHGGLDGDVHSRAMIVDKGGHYAGAVEISGATAQPALPPKPEPTVRVLPGWQPRLSFGWGS